MKKNTTDKNINIGNNTIKENNPSNNNAIEKKTEENNKINEKNAEKKTEIKENKIENSSEITKTVEKETKTDMKEEIEKETKINQTTQKKVEETKKIIPKTKKNNKKVENVKKIEELKKDTNKNEKNTEIKKPVEKKIETNENKEIKKENNTKTTKPTEKEIEKKTDIKQITQKKTEETNKIKEETVKNEKNTETKKTIEKKIEINEKELNKENKIESNTEIVKPAEKENENNVKQEIEKKTDIKQTTQNKVEETKKINKKQKKNNKKVEDGKKAEDGKSETKKNEINAETKKPVEKKIEQNGNKEIKKENNTKTTKPTEKEIEKKTNIKQITQKKTEETNKIKEETVKNEKNTEITKPVEKKNETNESKVESNAEVITSAGKEQEKDIKEEIEKKTDIKQTTQNKVEETKKINKKQKKNNKKVENGKKAEEVKTETKKNETNAETKKPVEKKIEQNGNKEKNNQNTNRKNNKTFSIKPSSLIQPIKPIPFVDLSKAVKEEKKNSIKREQAVVAPINPECLLSAEERNNPFFKNFYRDVESFVISEMLIGNGAKVLVGVSGGVDSVVLLDVMANLSAKYNFSICVAHYNHNLRGESSNLDEKFVKKLADSYNVPFYSQTGNVKNYSEKNSISIEEAARYLRYFFFERITRTYKFDFLTTAHTSDDSAETFLLNLFRGTGLTGLSGIPACRQFVKDVILFRPFIGLKKQKIIEYAKKRKLEWREDDSNLLDKYTRNKLRNDLIPKLKKDYSPAIVDIINRAAKLIHSADRIIHDYTRTHLPSVLTDMATDRVSIKLPLFKTFDEFIRGEMLISILRKYFRLQSPSMNTIDRILKLCNSDVGAICEITKNIFAIRDRQIITISRRSVPNKINEKIEKTGKYVIGNLTFVLKEVGIDEIDYSNNPNVEYVDFNLITPILTIRNVEMGDAFSPLGMTGKMKVNDFLTNEKTPILEKPNILLIVNSTGEIIWVCGKRINDRFKITDKTKKVLKMEIK
ncbi:MAG: tRNA lysidine(34) synthetase TilS [Candidatus Kapaibacterium sp.]|jgi:tRNA(Ile)-lysidine synthase